MRRTQEKGSNKFKLLTIENIYVYIWVVWKIMLEQLRMVAFIGYRNGNFSCLIMLVSTWTTWSNVFIFFENVCFEMITEPRLRMWRLFISLYTTIAWCEVFARLSWILRQKLYIFRNIPTYNTYLYRYDYLGYTYYLKINSKESYNLFTNLIPFISGRTKINCYY